VRKDKKIKEDISCRMTFQFCFSPLSLLWGTQFRIHGSFHLDKQW
jgi:hypothetical protein